MEERICKLYQEGYFTHEIAKILDISEAEVVRVLEDHHFIN